MRARRTPLYHLWVSMRHRCNNSRTPDYKYYGGRGIRVCVRWDCFAAFAGDVGPHPGRGWTLDRIDNNGDYEPSNVRWASRKTQSRNRNYCRLDKVTAWAIRQAYGSGRGRWNRIGKVTQTELAKQYGVTQVLISKVIRGEIW